MRAPRSIRYETRSARLLWLLGSACLLGAGAPAEAQNPPTRDQCVECHLTLDEERLRVPAELFENDVHGARGFDCLSCHGRTGPGDEGLDPSAGFLATPEGRQVPGLCGRCHSDAAFMRDYNPSLRIDQEAEYATSGHGRSLMETNDPDVATCVSCHPAHQIRAPTDPESSVYPLRVAELCASCHDDPDMMAPHNLPTDQLDEFQSSVHGRLMFEEEDLSAPTCNDCHGNHGAAPPGIASVRNVCGQCHTMMADFFAASGHVELFEEEDLPGCATCHDNHAIEETDDDLLAERSESVCGTCHEPDDPDGHEFETMKVMIDSLEYEAERSRQLLDEAERLGMEVSQAVFDLDEVNNALVKARTAIHAFQLEPVQQEIDVGLESTRSALERGEAALFEHWFRRAGLGLSAAIILALILALLIKIRNIEIRVEQMFSAVESFFRESMIASREAEGRISQADFRLAACALLIELVYADDEFSDAERRHLEELIRRRFDLDAAEAERLIQLAAEQRSRGADMDQFTALVARHFTEDEKRSLLDAMWGLVLSDGELAERERRLMDEITKRLSVEPEWRAGARTRSARRWMSMFFGAMRGRGGRPGDFEDLQLAASAILVELVYADEEFTEAERRHLEGLLQRQFGLGPVQAERLIRLTEERREAGFDIEEVAAVVAAHYSAAQKRALVDAMWSLVLSDGVLAEKERDLVGRIMELMGIEAEWARGEEGPLHRPPTGGGEDRS